MHAAFDRREIVLEFSMSLNYIYCLDLIAFVCILVIANRPDGLAITASALILGAGALLYRCVPGVKAKLEAPLGQRKAERQFGQRVRPAAPAPVAVPAKPDSKSWLRDSE
jgi:hypothetical protein